MLQVVFKDNCNEHNRNKKHSDFTNKTAFDTEFKFCIHGDV